jgi:multiple sugar transport system substrate-binding protein
MTTTRGAHNHHERGAQVRGMTTKHLRLLTAAALGSTMLVLSSTGASASPQRDSLRESQVGVPPAVPKTAKITLTEYDYYTPGTGNSVAVKDAIAAFEKMYPNVTIQQQEVPFSGVPKLVDLEAAGKAPNIIIEDQTELDQYYAGIVPMSQFFTPQFIDQFALGSRQTAIQNGTLYGLQVLGGNTLALFYNPTDFANAGIKAPPATWAQLLADAKLLTDPAADRYGFAVSAIANEGATWQLEPFVWSSGGTLGNPDSAAWQQSVGLFSEMVKDGYMPKAVVGWQQGDETTHFIDNNVAMMINGPWNIPGKGGLASQNTVKWAVAPIPVQTPGDKLIVPIGGEAWSVGKASPVLEAASAAFIQFVTEDHSLNITLANLGGYLPTIISEVPGYATKYPAYAAFARELLNGRARVYKNSYGQLSIDVQTMIQTVLTGKASVSQALSTLTTQVKAIPNT